MKTRYTRTTETLNRNARTIPALKIGDRVFIQNQRGPHPTKWDASGTIMEEGQHDQYTVKVDGTGRVTLRNRRFLRKFTPVTTTIAHKPQPQVQTVPTLSNQQRITADPSEHLTPTALQPINHPDYATDTPDIPLERAAPSPPQADPTGTDPPVTQANTPVPEPRVMTRVRAPPKRYVPETGTWE